MIIKATEKERILIAKYMRELMQKGDVDISIKESDFDGWTEHEKQQLCRKVSMWWNKTDESYFDNVLQIGTTWMIAHFGVFLIDAKQ